MRLRQQAAGQLLAIGLLLYLTHSAFAARLLKAIIQLDGHTVLQSAYQDAG